MQVWREQSVQAFHNSETSQLDFVLLREPKQTVRIERSVLVCRSNNIQRRFLLYLSFHRLSIDSRLQRPQPAIQARRQLKERPLANGSVARRRASPALWRTVIELMLILTTFDCMSSLVMKRSS